MNPSINYIINQLKSNGEDRENFNKITAVNVTATYKTHKLAQVYRTKKESFLTFSFIDWWDSGYRGVGFSLDESIEIDDDDEYVDDQDDPDAEYGTLFEDLLPYQQQYIIRTALSRIDGKAVLSGLEGKQNYTYPLKVGSIEEIFVISERLYEAFDYPLRNGQGIDKAIQALDKKMIELGIITI